ncbi:MAG: exosortase [Aquabacterium sp.]
MLRPLWTRLRPDHLLMAALVLFALPTLARVAQRVWTADEQGHGPVLLAVAGWLAWQRRGDALLLMPRPAPAAGWTLLVLAAALQVVGASQGVLELEAAALPVAATGAVLMWLGPQALRSWALPLALLVLVVPWPGIVVQTLTLPMKIAVSGTAEWLMHGLGLPVARSGVVLAIDRYHLLVADACAGLNSLFTLEAMGLVYLHLRRTAAPWRLATLAVLLVPIAFLANVARVVVLVLVTYRFGDAAGQGFAHMGAGLLLFAVAIGLMLAVDGLLGRLRPAAPLAPGAAT